MTAAADIWTTSQARGEALKATVQSAVKSAVQSNVQSTVQSTVQGQLTAAAPLMRHSWFRTGGPADLLFEPAGEGDLAAFLQGLPSTTPVTLLGVGSNILVRDGGLRGVVIRLGKAFAGVQIEGNKLQAGAAAMDVHVAKAAAKASLAGLEFLVGIPGTIGGAIAMNAGAYGHEIKDILIKGRAMDRAGALHHFTTSDYDFTYRRSGLPADWIILSATLQAVAGQKDSIQARMTEISTTRQDSQPIGTRTGGSTFKNPDPEISNGRSAWQLIDLAGCRGMRIGDAQISEKHCNFLINHGKATAFDLETLGEAVRKKVLETTGVSLEWEVKIIGEKA